MVFEWMTLGTAPRLQKLGFSLGARKRIRMDILKREDMYVQHIDKAKWSDSLLGAHRTDGAGCQR
jgi:hypothetical protein